MLLDEVDKELEQRGLVFARYADDLNVYTGSKRAADDAMATLKRLFARLRLQVNESKSAVARVWERKFLGYSFWVAPGRVVRPRVAPAALADDEGARAAHHEPHRRTEPDASRRRNCGAISPAGSTTSSWPRRPASSTTSTNGSATGCAPCSSSSGSEAPTAYRELRARDVPDRIARAAAAHARRWWATAAHGALKTALPISYFDRLGLPRLAGR